MHERHLIAMGGGGFSMEPDNLALDRYVLEHSRAANPVVCFLPTASGDADSYIVKFYAAFTNLPCRPRHLSLFRQPPDLAKQVAECDVIYVGGGNTRNMLAIWRSCGMDQLLQRSWHEGTVLCGISAGAICWFEQGLTDSFGGFDPMPCLGFLPGSCTPHYDGEAGRRPSLQTLIKQGRLAGGLALDDGAAAHFVGTELREIVTSRSAARAFDVRYEHDEIIEQPLTTRYLNGSQQMV